MVLNSFERGIIIGGYEIYLKLKIDGKSILNYSEMTEFSYSTVERMID